MELSKFGEDNALDSSMVAAHHEFTLAKTDSDLNEKYYSCCPDTPYQDITFTLHLKRVGNSINHVIVTPSVLFNLFLPVIFLLSPEFEEKIHYGIGLLVANTLLLLLVVDIIGMLHLIVPPLANYHLLNIALSCLALAISAVIRNIWSKGQRGCRMHNLVKTYFLGIFGRMMCVSRDDYMPVGGGQQDNIVRQQDIVSSDVMDDSQKEDDREQILRNFARNAQAAEWKQLAVTLDRLSFVLFFVISVITTIALLSR